MHHDPGIPRFFAYLSLFTFFMLMLVTADNLVQLFFGWEGVGLASYLLIGFWYEPTISKRGRDQGLFGQPGWRFWLCCWASFATFVLFETVQLDTIFAAVPGKADAQLVFLGYEFHALTVICLLLFIGAMGKSAQLGCTPGCRTRWKVRHRSLR